jgi:tetrapyrrole (corrin/porphyrin) methylase-like protein
MRHLRYPEASSPAPPVTAVRGERSRRRMSRSPTKGDRQTQGSRDRNADRRRGHAEPSNGCLTVVGTGIRSGLQTTWEARGAIRRATLVLYLTTDPLADAWVRRLNASARTLAGHYKVGRPRQEVYDSIVEEILDAVRQGLDVCAVFYGHPGVFVNPSHEAIAGARKMGYPAKMLPAVSAEDCLVADLGVDPGEAGWQTYEATDFLMHRRAIDTTTPLVLWQVSMIGAWHTIDRPSVQGLRLLADRLAELYGPGHEVVLYEAAAYPLGDPMIIRVRVDAFAAAPITAMTTLYIPPRGRPEPEPDMIARLQRSSGDAD